MIEVGSIVGGKFRIDRILGRGGMGVVALATHLQLEQQVALKVVHDALAGDAEIVQRFLREARASARLRSEHACKVSDVGQLDTGAPYIVMELLDGSDLAVVIADGALPIATASDYVLQACVAVAEAHALGIVHRDLKPANLFLTRRLDGTPLIKVLDFGIAKAANATDFKITRTQTVMGSPGYMSPEQLRSAREAEPRSDIWALGVILYELVTGRLPFDGDSVTELAVKVVMDPPAPLGLDAPAFERIVYRCLEKAPEQRYPTVAALAAELAPLAAEGGGRSASMIAALAGAATGPMMGATTGPTTGATGATGSPSQAAGRSPSTPVVSGKATTLETAAAQSTGSPIPPPPRTRSSAGLVVGAIALVVVAAAITLFAIRRSGPSGPARPPIAAATSDARIEPPAGPATPSTAGTPGATPDGTMGAAVHASAGPTADAAASNTTGPSGGSTASATAGVTPGATPGATTDATSGPVANAAAATAPASPGSVAEIRAKLQTLAASHDWFAVLQLADLDRGDPQIADLVREAKRQYVAQQARAIDAQIKQGQCARAREIAVAAHQVVHDDSSLDARARTCKPRPATASAPPAPPTLDEGDQAFRRGEFSRALDLAERLLAAEPANAAALRVAALSACGAKSVDKAAQYSARLPARERAEARDLCDRNSIELDDDHRGPDEPPGPPDRPGEPDDKLAGDADLTEAMRAAATGRWEPALTHAEAVLQRTPRNLRALGIGVTAACHLRRDSVARSLLRRLPLHRQRALRQACARDGVLL